MTIPRIAVTFAVIAVAFCGTVSVHSATSRNTPSTTLHLPAAVGAAMAGIDGERMRAHVQFLSDDLLEGRGPGVRGGDVAALYIAAQFELLGLLPAGENGTYFQSVNVKGVQTRTTTTASVQSATGAAWPLTLGEDFVTSNQTQTAVTDLDAPIVFVGYGIDAPQYRWNDYQGIDVKGKVVLVIINEPPSKDLKFFSGEALTYYGRWVYKFEQAARQGAGHYYRSDHFSFARVGVPAFSVGTGSTFVGQKLEWGKAQYEQFNTKNYHRPSDEYTAQMDFTSNVMMAQFGFALGWQALNANSTVNWLPGDEFEAARLRSVKQP